MRATVKVEFNEQSKGVTAQAKVELEGDCNNEEELQALRTLALKESKEAFSEAFKTSQAYSMRK